MTIFSFTMAGRDVSNRDLWQFITGTSLTKPKKLVEDEIINNETKLRIGLQFYDSQRNPAGERLKKERKLDDVVIEFVKKLSQFLGLDEIQCHDLYKLYTTKEYRGSAADLQTFLTVERHSQIFISKLRDYYFSERLYLLRSVKHILSYWQESDHPYRTQYAKFVKKLYDSEEFIKDVRQQYEKICKETAPTWETRGKFMNERHSKIWVIQNLREQYDLLEILVLYYSKAALSPASLLELSKMFKQQGFGKRQTNRHLLDEHAEPLLQKIGFLQVVLLVEALDMEHLLSAFHGNKIRSHHVVASDKFDSIEQYMESLGQSSEHGPLLLAWAAIRELSSKGEEGKTASFGNRALNVKVFPYMVSQLKSDAFSGKSVTVKLCHTIMYGMMKAVLEAFHQDTLGDREGLQELATVLLKQSTLADDFWKVGMDSGLGCLFLAATECFPLDLCPLVDICIALGQASESSAQNVNKLLQNMRTYTEILSNASEVKATREQNMWKLIKDRYPYHAMGSELVIPSGTAGEYHQVGSMGVVQWASTYDAWEIFGAEVLLLLQQVSHGAGMVQVEKVRRVTHICRLTQALVSKHPKYISTIPQMAALKVHLYQIINRFSQVQPPPLELLAASVEVIHQMALQDPVQTWLKLQQAGLLPHLTENIDNFSEVSSGSGLNTGAYGKILAGTECTHGQYPLTIAFLDLVSALIQPLNKCGKVDTLLASVLTISREIFPVFSKWRYQTIMKREAVGQKCLQIFHKILNILGQDKDAPPQNRVSVRDACVYSLLFTEAGQALLDIVGTSVDTVNAALSSQGSATEGAGVQLIQMIRMSFSVLNRLLLLRPAEAPSSPVEASLSSQTSSLGGRKNTMATIAQYIYHRHDPRLAILAMVLLKRLAMIFPMSILACLGDEAESVRDVFLSRLQAETEDVRLKVAILELLSACVETQPGLTEIFLNVKALCREGAPGGSTKKKDKKDTKDKGSKSDDCPRKGSCLQAVMTLIQDKKQGTYECPSQLLCAAVEFIHALWHGGRETAMAALRDTAGFWHSICLSLTRKLQSASEADSDLQVLQREVKSCANILKILALELYNNHGAKMDANLKNVLSEILSQDTLLYWSMYLRDSMKWSSNQEEVAPSGELHENSTLQLLLAWRNLLLVLGNVSKKVKSLSIPDEAKEQILRDLLHGTQCQIMRQPEITVLNIKLASVASAFYLTLLKQWIEHIDSWQSTVLQLEAILSQSVSSCELLIPAVQIGLLGALTLVLQHARLSKCEKPLTEKHLTSLVPLTCGMVQQSTYQLPPPPATPGVEPPATKAALTQPLNTSGSSFRTNTSLLSNTKLHDNSDLSGTISSQEVQMEGQGQEKGSETNYSIHKEIEVKLKLQTAGICLLEALIACLPSVELWLPEVKQFSLLHNLLASIEPWIQTHQGAEYVQTVMTFFLTVTRHPQGAESLAVNSFIQQLCLVLSPLYDQQDQAPCEYKGLQHKSNPTLSVRQAPTWSSIYCHSIALYTALLDTLKYNFLQYALEFVGVHQDRMFQCLHNAGIMLHADILQEAEETCRFLKEISGYRREWRLRSPEVLQRLMSGVCLIVQRCVSLLIRPSLLQHMLEKQRSGQDIGQVITQDKFIASPFIRSMSQQPSDDADHPTQEVMVIQNRLLSVACQSVIALRKFSPDLCEIITDQSLDVGEYEAFLQIGFSTPSVEQDTPPTFGTLVSCISLCLFLLNKVDPRGPMGTPPARQDSEKSPIERSLVMFVLENTLYLIMSQALRGLRDPELPARDKQLLKRELSAELNSFLSGMQRYLRRSSGGHTPSAMHNPALSEANYLKLVDIFVRKVLR